jgi:hypothetical protein
MTNTFTPSNTHEQQLILAWAAGTVAATRAASTKATRAISNIKTTTATHTVRMDEETTTANLTQ